MSLSTVAGLHFISALCLDPPPFTHARTFLIFFPVFPSPLFLHPYLFISISLIFVVVSVDCAPSSGTHLPTALRPLNSASQGRADRRGGSGIIFDDLFIVLLQFAGGSQYNIHLSMHNTGWDQSWVKDNSKDCRLGLDCGAGAQTAASGAETSSVTSALPRSLRGDSSVLSFPRLSTSL